MRKNIRDAKMQSAIVSPFSRFAHSKPVPSGSGRQHPSPTMKMSPFCGRAPYFEFLYSGEPHTCEVREYSKFLRDFPSVLGSLVTQTWRDNGIPAWPSEAKHVSLKHEYLVRHGGMSQGWKPVGRSYVKKPYPTSLPQEGNRAEVSRCDVLPRWCPTPAPPVSPGTSTCCRR